MPAFHVFISKDLSKEAFIHWTDFEGKRHRRKGGINKRHTIAGRKAAALTLLAELEKSFLKDMRYVPMQERLRVWLRARRGWIRLKSYQTFQSIIEGFLSWIGNNIITSDLVLEFFVDLSQRRHPTTYGAYRSLLMKAFKELGEPEFMNGVERLKTIKTPAKYFQVSQTERLKKYLLQHDPEL